MHRWISVVSLGFTASSQSLTGGLMLTSSMTLRTHGSPGALVKHRRRMSVLQPELTPLALGFGPCSIARDYFDTN